MGLLAACPSGWTDSGNACFLVIVQSQPFVNAANARQVCMANGGDLASFNNRTDETTVYDLLRSQVCFLKVTHLVAYIHGFTTAFTVLHLVTLTIKDG